MSLSKTGQTRPFWATYIKAKPQLDHAKNIRILKNQGNGLKSERRGQ